MIFEPAKAVSAGRFHSLVLLQDTSVWVTGSNAYGQLGDESTTNRLSFMPVGLSGASCVVAGRDYSIVLKHDGSVWATGRNQHGHLAGSRFDNV